MVMVAEDSMGRGNGMTEVVLKGLGYRGSGEKSGDKVTGVRV